MESELFRKYTQNPVIQRITERGQLMQHFRERINRARMGTRFPPISMARMGKLLEAIPTKDLYYLKSVCDDARHNPRYCSRKNCSDLQHFSMKFFYELKPRNEGTVAAYGSSIPVENM